MVECQLPKLKVAGSSPVSRSSIHKIKAATKHRSSLRLLFREAAASESLPRSHTKQHEGWTFFLRVSSCGFVEDSHSFRTPPRDVKALPTRFYSPFDAMNLIRSRTRQE